MKVTRPKPVPESRRFAPAMAGTAYEVIDGKDGRPVAVRETRAGALDAAAELNAADALGRDVLCKTLTR